MKRLLFGLCLLVATTFAFADVKAITTTHLGVNTKLDASLTEIPDAPAGYHLIGVETVYISEGKDRIVRVFYFSDDPDNHAFALSFADIHED